jgi:hypothetical protein
MASSLCPISPNLDDILNQFILRVIQMSIASKLTVTIRSALVLESDPGMQKMISNYLAALGVERIDFFTVAIFHKKQMTFQIYM